ncbi:MAG TPA: TolC family protein [Flavobacteriaceae bacterium]|nr:TolC family protein [Flavobacteriaceae bacterium]MCB9213468.1 TolC family protein [Alteromonas sp.]HPF12229.1 TolC family protein [Flavobacteriaceae bacterium]HQU21984.1 TolC family protein [Flavobacteriaceae bacterium]HQU65883.1 TolC family protein [Flavobacteriaceae bacterium]
MRPRNLAVFAAVFLSAVFALPAQTLTLEDCYASLEANYPLAKQKEMYEHQNRLEQQVLENGKLPQLQFGAQATYQSEVTEVPLPNSPIEPLSKDQYKATLTAQQLLFHGGTIDASVALMDLQKQTRQKWVEVSLQQLKAKVNQLYFSILMHDNQFELLATQKSTLGTALAEVTSAVHNGVALPSSDKVLQAELLLLKQRILENRIQKKALVVQLLQTIGQPIDTIVHFETAPVTAKSKVDFQSPRKQWYQLQREALNQQQLLLSKSNVPTVSAFVTGGYGKPGLNLLDNSFRPYYLAGLKLDWKVFDWNSNKIQRSSLEVSKEMIDVEEELFDLTTKNELSQQQVRIDQLSAAIEIDIAIVELQEAVVKASQSQLRNGVITASSYLTDLTKLFEAKTNEAVHRIELQMAIANYNVLLGY